MRALPPTCATNFHVAKRRNSVYFPQHENLLRAEVVIRATNNRNLQCNIVARQVSRKCCPYYLTVNLIGGMVSEPAKNTNRSTTAFLTRAVHLMPQLRVVDKPRKKSRKSENKSEILDGI